MSEIKEKFFVHELPSLKNRRVEMYHANTDEDSKERIMDQFMKDSGNIQVLISTVAFGMGINISDVDIVIHWGLPTTSLSYWQEIGRCARDGRQGYAICYAFKRSVTKCQEDELKTCVKLKTCIRYSVLDQFLLDGMSKAALECLNLTSNCSCDCESLCKCTKCKCCIVCLKSCICEKKSAEPLKSFI